MADHADIGLDVRCHTLFGLHGSNAAGGESDVNALLAIEPGFKSSDSRLALVNVFETVPENPVELVAAHSHSP